MVENVTVEKGDLIAAYMTTAHVASSYKVESTKTIVEGWSKFRSMALGWDEVDFLATLLSLPSIFGTAEMDPSDENALNQVVNQIGLMKDELSKEDITSADEKALALAFLTNASVAHSKGMPSRKATIQQYKDIQGMISLEDNKDLLASYLTIARLMDVKKHPVTPDLVKEMYDGMRAEVDKGLDDNMRPVLDNGFGDNLMAACSLTAAYIEISPKVEKYKDIMQTWASLLEHTMSTDPSETVAVVLFSGKIRDLDSMHLLQLGSISDQIGSIKQLVESYQQA